MVLAAQPKAFAAAAQACVEALRGNEKISEVLRLYGFTYLQHYTHFANVPHVFKAGAIMSNSARATQGDTAMRGGYGHSNGIVCFTLSRHAKPPPENDYQFYSGGNLFDDSTGTRLWGGDMKKAMFMFDFTALNNAVFRISSNFWNNHGAPGSRDFNSHYGARSLFRFLKSERNQLGEVVVPGMLPLDYLSSVWVAGVRREEVLTELRAQGISTFRGQPIENFIRSPDSSTKIIPFSDPQWGTFYRPALPGEG
jgi:hypothetical protein